MLLSGGIAFFDSGIGGLTVLHSCLKYLKNERIYYYGDNLRAPYGNLPKEKIQEYVKQAFELFSRLRVKAVVIACNTVTALCIDELRKEYAFPIIGVEPALYQAAKKGGEILALCTKRTAESMRIQALKLKTERRYLNARIELYPCEKLAGVIEQSPFALNGDLTEYLPNRNADAVVLGCTHYIYYKKYIEQFYNCPVFDGNDGTARRLFCLLNHDLLKNRDEQPLERNFCPNAPNYELKSMFFAATNIEGGVCGRFGIEKYILMREKPYGNSLFFWGSGQENNVNMCKQMFAFTKNG